MLGMTLKIDETDQYLVLNIAPDLARDKVEAKFILDIVQKSRFKHFFTCLCTWLRPISQAHELLLCLTIG